PKRVHTSTLCVRIHERRLRVHTATIATPALLQSMRSERWKQETLVDQAGKETPGRGTNARRKCWTLALLRRGHPGNKTEPPTSCNIRRRTSSHGPHRILPPPCYLTQPQSI